MNDKDNYGLKPISFTSIFNNFIERILMYFWKDMTKSTNSSDTMVRMFFGEDIQKQNEPYNDMKTFGPQIHSQ